MWTADIWHENDCIPQAQELREVCQDFLGDIGDFQKIADSFIVIFDAVSKEVETEKMKVYDFKFDLIARILQGNVESKTLMTLKMDFWWKFAAAGNLSSKSD